MSSSNSPCAACKFLRRKCTQECVFAPYFPPDQPQKFANVHKVFGASNVAKLLNDLNSAHREDAVNSLAYEADARLRDPVYGCVGLISILQHRLKQIKDDLENAKKELATYIGPSVLPMLQHPGFIQQHPSNHSSSVIRYNMSPMLGLSPGPNHGNQLVIRDTQQQQQQPHPHQQMLDAQQFAAVIAAREQQELIRSYEQQELMRYNGGFDPAGSVPVGAAGFNQMTSGAMSPSLALGNFDNPYQIQQQEHHHHPHHQLQAQLMLHPQQPPQQQQQQQPLQLQQQQQQRSGSEEGRSVGPSC